MNLQLEQAEVSQAVQSGLSLLSPDSTATVPASEVEGLYHLKRLLLGIASNTYGLVPMVHKKPEKDDDGD